MRKVDFESVCESRFEGYRAAGCETSSMGGSDVNVVVRGESGNDEEGCVHREVDQGHWRARLSRRMVNFWAIFVH